MTLDVLFIGDPHFQIANIADVDIFMKEIREFAKERLPDIIVISGDLLHTHERLHTLVMNKACAFIQDMTAIAYTYILVGNHDYISNTQYLSDNHWMNFLKNWPNLTIVDRVIMDNISGHDLVFVPYVYPGRFKEALNTLDYDVNKCDCIFAHQEFKGCKMGAIISDIGDDWLASAPLVVSGHIHQSQWVGKNIYYPGTPMQHSFGESGNKSVVILSFSMDKPCQIDEHCLNVPTKRILYVHVDELDDLDITVKTDEKIRITLKGTIQQFKSVKKTSVFTKLLDQGIKISFKTEEEDVPEYSDTNKANVSFTKTLDDLVKENKDTFLTEAYEYVLHDRNILSDDIFFL